MRINSKIRLMVLWIMIFASGQVFSQVQPKFNLATAVTGADAYQISLTKDMDEYLFTGSKNG